MPDVFISYSRCNLDFVQRLSDALTARGKEVWFDQIKEPLQGLPPASRWWDEIKYGIETADNFLFIISPDSIASPYCNAEIAHALRHERRMVTVLYRGTDSEADTLRAIDEAIDNIPEDSELPSTVSADITNLRSLTRRNWLEIGQIQYVAFSEGVAFEQSLELLAGGLDLDLAWIRTWSRVRQSVQLWAENNFDGVYLWPEERLVPIRETVKERKQELTDLERRFLEPEQQRLLRELENREATHERRRDIGDRLSVIGDTRPGVGVHDDGTPDIVWLPVNPGGKIKIEEQTFTVRPFYIARYQVTYAQFDAFCLADDGFNEERWWVEMPDEFTWEDYLQDQRTKILNTPRDNISWYQSVAFSRWLNNRLCKWELPNPDNKRASPFIIGGNVEVRLPTEWEWQWAAQAGVEQRRYPWGKWQDGYANTLEAGLIRPVAVGMYPHGSAACGAMDMAGNLYEWCLNDYASPQIADGYGNDAEKVLRGGSFANPGGIAACAFRADYAPYRSDRYYGLRLVCAPPVRL